MERGASFPVENHKIKLHEVVHFPSNLKIKEIGNKNCMKRSDSISVLPPKLAIAEGFY